MKFKIFLPIMLFITSFSSLASNNGYVTEIYTSYGSHDATTYIEAKTSENKTFTCEDRYDSSKPVSSSRVSTFLEIAKMSMILKLEVDKRKDEGCNVLVKVS